jgi:1-acyl-sn-glycerol-3-phosphate acyltransferase
MSRRPAHKRLWYDSAKFCCAQLTVALWRLRSEGHEWIPDSGGGLMLANHQAVFDPALIGISCRRRMHYVARDTLFKAPLLGSFLRSLDTIPIQRDGMAFSGIKETLRRLRDQELVLLFPEGTRTFDGELQPLKPGFVALARRARVPLFPVAIEGGFQAWPRWRFLPGGGRIWVQFGRPVPYCEYQDWDDPTLLREVSRRIADCQQQARHRLRHRRA